MGELTRGSRRALAEAGIDYRHHKELAPTTELRRLQYREDARLGVGKRSRVVLAPEYVERYTREILDHVDLGRIVEEMPADGASRAASASSAIPRPATARSSRPACRPSAQWR